MSRLMPPEKMGIHDSVVAKLGNVMVKPHIADPVKTHTDKMGVRANVHVVLRGPDGKIKYEEFGENLVTDIGDGHLAKRMYDDTENIVTGMKLGTGATAADKNGTGAASIEVGTYITGSEEALDAVPIDASKGAGAGWRTPHICTWIAGDVTNGAIAEVSLTNQTALADNASLVADTIARYVFGATIDKQVGDSLEVTWNIDFLGS